jgi:hypothetical protein
MKTSTNRILTVIYCDDIRQEIGNKMSLMGCYQDDILVPSSPIFLPKLCVLATVRNPDNRPFKRLVLRVFLDNGTELFSVDLLSGNVDSQKTINTALIISPLGIEQESTLHVVADTEEGEIVGPCLSIKIAPNLDGIVPTHFVSQTPGTAT